MALIDPDTLPQAQGPANLIDPDDVRSAAGEVGAGLERGVRGDFATTAGKALQATGKPGDTLYDAGSGIISRAAAANEKYAAQPEQHGDVTNVLAKGAQMGGAFLPAIGVAAAAPEGFGAAALTSAGVAVPYAMQAFQEQYEKHLAAHPGDEVGAVQAGRNSGAVQEAAMALLPGVGGKVAGKVAGRVLGPAIADAAGAGAREIAAPSVARSLTEAGAENVGGNVSMMTGSAAGQAAVDQSDGTGTQSPLEAAKEALPGALGAAALFSPLAYLHASKAIAGGKASAAAIQAALADPKAPPEQRAQAVRHIYDAMEKADPDGANMWAINAGEALHAGQPIGVDASWTTGPHESVFPEVAQSNPDGTLALPAPGRTVAAASAGEGPFDLTQQHAANTAADENEARWAARDAAEKARLQASGPLGQAAAAGMDSGAVDHMATQRAAEVPPGEPPEPPEGGSPQDQQAQANITAWTRSTPGLPLAEAQARSSAIEADGKPYTVVPHPQGGYAVVPDHLITPQLSEQYAGLQRGGQLPQPGADVPGRMIGKDGRTPVAPTYGELPPAGRPFPFPTPEAAQNRADALTMRTGTEHEVVPHPYARDKFAVQEKQSFTEGEQATGAEHAVQEPSAGEVLQREPEQAGVGGGERGRVEPGVQGQEVAGENQTAGQTPDDRARLQQAGVAEHHLPLFAAPPLEVTDIHGGRQATPEEAANISRSISGTDVDGGLHPMLQGTTISVFDPAEPGNEKYGDAAYLPMPDAIMLRADHAGTNGKVSERVVSGHLIHEGGHRLARNADGSDMAENHPAFDIEHGDDGERHAVGGLMQEALGAFDSKDTATSKYLKYPLRYWDADHADANLKNRLALTATIKSELFAQLVAFHAEYPDIMREELPKAFAFIERIQNDIHSSKSVSETNRLVRQAFRATSAEGGHNGDVKRSARSEDAGGARQRGTGPGMAGEDDNERGQGPARSSRRGDDDEVRAKDLRGDGRGFTDFFTDATKGGRAPNTGKKYAPVLDIGHAKSFSAEYNKHRGNFDDHIATSIPGFREVQQAVGNAIVKTLGDGSRVLDIGASEGSFIKAITKVSGGKIRTVGMDPNPAMAKFFEEHSVVPGSRYDMSAFSAHSEEGQEAWTEDDGTKINNFKPDGKFDLAHEAMTFQFISDARDAQVARVKEMLKPDGVAMFEQKFTPAGPEFKANEAKKDAYKAQYYSQDELARKKKDVLERGAEAHAADEAKKEEKIVGMHNLMVSPEAFEKTLTDNFQHVVQYWDSGNFKGYAASDSLPKLREIVRNLGSLKSDYSTRDTPRRVSNHMVNIGLQTKDRKDVTQADAARAVRALKATGAEVTRHETRVSNTEPTLVASLSRKLTDAEAHKIAADLGQEAIAQRSNGVGSMHGPEKEKWEPFDNKYFLEHSPEFRSRNGELHPNVERDVAGIKDVAKHLLPAERDKLNRGSASRLVSFFNGLEPNHLEMGAAALAGAAKRGWYREGVKAFVHVFGPDAPRFAALMGALSPRNTVEDNTRQALAVWHDWIKAGRPTDNGKIFKILDENARSYGPEGNMLKARVPNAVRALTAEDPRAVMLSGPKVASFYKNLIGDVHEVTNDGWMAAYASIDARLFGGQLSEVSGDPGKSVPYLAMSALTRKTAKYLTKLTGEEWTPTEVQETVWSWAKTLYETAEAAGEDRSMVQLVKDKAITDALIKSTPDFRTLLHEDTYAKLLKQAGYGEQLESLARGGDHGAAGREGSEAGGKAAPAPNEALLRRAAARLDKLREERRSGGKGDAYEDDLKQITDEDDDGIKFSRRSNGDLDTRDANFKKWFGKSTVVTDDLLRSPKRLYHGTLKDFVKFDPTIAQMDNSFGRGIYMTDTPADASHNYASIDGPDLKSKIDDKAEEILNSMGEFDYGTTAYRNAYNSARRQAEYALADHGGAIMPLYAKITKPFVIAGKNETFLPYDGHDGGKFIDFVTALRGIADSGRFDVDGLDQTLGHLMEDAVENGGIGANDLVKNLAFWAIDNETGRSVSAGGIIRMALEDIGFDGIEDHSVLDRWGRMQGVEKGTTHYIAFKPNQVKSAVGNSGSFSARNTDIRFSRRDELAPPFYSALDRAIADKAPFARDGTANAQMLRNWLESRTKDGTVKRDEIAWTGIDDWLKLQDGKVTRDQVQQFLDQHGVKVEETMLNDSSGRAAAERTRHLHNAYAEAGNRVVQLRREANDTMYGKSIRDEAIKKLPAAEAVWAEAKDRLDKAAAEARTTIESNNPTHFADYQLPGGKNYRELLLTLPTKESRNVANQIPPSQHDLNATFKSSHFDQPNILAHVRFNERTDANGKKVLFIEELQSDWAQKGRREGFRDQEKPHATRDELRKQLREVTAAHGADSDEAHTVRDALRGFESQTGAIPSAPFVGKTEAWTALAMKRMIRYAADNGFDRVAWTNGEQQAARYDLSKQIKEISVNSKQSDGTRAVTIDPADGYKMKILVQPDGDVIGYHSAHVFTGKKLDEVIGKEMAAKVMEAKPGTKFSGLDLKVGGEGMKSFYDKIIPNVANDVLKKLGGGRVDNVQIKDPSMYRKHDGNPEDGFVGTDKAVVAQPGFDITPSMRAKVVAGQPRFSRRGGETVPDRELETKLTGKEAEQQFTKSGKPVSEVVDKVKPEWISKASAETQSFLEKAGVYVPKKTWRQRWTEIKQDLGLKILQQTVDQYRPVLEKIGKYPYQLLRMASAHDAGLAALVQNGHVEMNKWGALRVKAGTQSFKDIMSPLAGEADRMLGWMAAQRAQELMAEGREHNFTKEEIAAGLKLNGDLHADDKFAGEGTRAAAYTKAMKGFSEMNKSVLDVAEHAGLLDPEARRAFEREFYVPFFREEDGEREVNPSNISGMVNQYATKRLKGGEAGLHDLMANTMQNWSHLLSASLKNNAAWQTLEHAESLGIAQRIKTAEAAKGDVYVKQDGKDVYFHVNDSLVLQAISSLGAVPMRGPIMRGLGMMKHALTVGTTWSPIFRIRHTVREQITALAANPTGYNPVKNWIDGFKYSSKDNPEYGNMAAGGAFFHMGLDLEGNRAAYVKRLIAHEIDPKTLVDSEHKSLQMLGHMADWWKETGERSDSITRANLYRQTFARMIAEGHDQDRAHFEASYVARDAMDYSLHGINPAVRMLTQVVPFMNARMQGLYKLGRGAAEDPKRFAAVVGGITLATIALSLAQRKDKDVQQASEWDRDNNWLIHVGNVMYRIPKPFEVGAVATVADRALEVALNGFEPADRERFVARLVPILGAQLNLNPIPQAVFPALELWANKNTFTGTQIEPGRDERLSTAQHISPNTSLTARALGSAGVLSPEQIDFAVGAYLGWVGTHVVNTVDLALRASGQFPTKAAPRLDDYFLIGDFAHQVPSDNSRFVSDFYQHMQKIQQAFGDMRMLQQTGQFEQAAKLFKSKGDEIQLHGLYLRTQREIGDLNRRQRYVNMSNMTADEKRAELDRLAQVKNALAATAEKARAATVNRQR